MAPAQRALQRPPAFSPPTLLCFILLIAPSSCGLLVIYQRSPCGAIILAVYYAIINILTIALYNYDKNRARTGLWRINESRLHFCELAGGWPAAFIAQRWLRHKIRKRCYQVVFWVIVAVHEAVWCGLFYTARRW